MSNYLEGFEDAVRDIISNRNHLVLPGEKPEEAIERYASKSMKELVLSEIRDNLEHFDERIHKLEHNSGFDPYDDCDCDIDEDEVVRIIDDTVNIDDIKKMYADIKKMHQELIDKQMTL